MLASLSTCSAVRDGMLNRLSQENVGGHHAMALCTPTDQFCRCSKVGRRCGGLVQEVILKGVHWDRVIWGMPLMTILQRLRMLVLTDNHLSHLHQVHLLFTTVAA